ncbi:MAG: hypothetical protein LBG06_10115 [Deltaproteobacteria bacterium]|jgi:hypothetical protein|nr:hypothetical protein [Deltaproteobacteria bacterium]
MFSPLDFTARCESIETGFRALFDSLTEEPMFAPVATDADIESALDAAMDVIISAEAQAYLRNTFPDVPGTISKGIRAARKRLTSRTYRLRRAIRLYGVI